MTIKSSGSISMSEINAEFGRGNNLNSYRGTQWNTDSGGVGTFSSGAIAMNEFYNKRLTSPVTAWIDIGEPTFTFGTVTSFGGCGASGWYDGQIRISAKRGISISVTRWYADYSLSPIITAYNGGWYYVCQSSAFMNASGTPYTNTIVTNAYGAAGRDQPRFRVRTVWNGSNLTVYVDADCKGGGYGYGHVAFASDIGYNINRSENYSYGSNPDYGANMPHSWGRGGLGSFFAMT